MESLRMSWVSVTILVGMRLRMSSSSGRMSCKMARCSVITKMFSSSKMARAGRESGILMGMGEPPYIIIGSRIGTDSERIRT